MRPLLRRGTPLPLLSRAAGILLGVAAVPAGAQPIRALVTPTAGIPATAPVAPRPLESEDVAAGTLRVSPVRFDRALHAELRSAFTGSMEAPARLVLVSPFPGVTFALVLRRSPFATAGPDHLTVLSGEALAVAEGSTATVQSVQRLQGAQGAQAASALGTYTLVLDDEGVSLSVLSPTGNYHVHPGLSGRLEAFQEDPTAPMRCVTVARDGHVTTAPSPVTATAVARREPAERSELVVLALYTDDAISAIGGDEAGLQAEIVKGVDLLDLSLRNSEVRVTARLASGRALPAPTAFAASPGAPTPADADLRRLRENAEVAELRQRYGADVVTLVRGRTDAWSATPTTAAHGAAAEDGAFAVVSARKVVDGLGLAHAVGHLLGAHHDAEHLDDGAASAPPYARGWHAALGTGAPPSIHVGGVMSIVGQRAPYFSNPRVRYLGRPTGSESQDNARAMNEARAAATGHRP